MQRAALSSHGRWSRRLSLLAACAVLAGCQPRAAGPDGTPPSHPRIVSLNPCTDAVLADVAAPGQLLAVSHYSHDPASTSMGVARAATFGKVSDAVEDILALRPDVVVASSFLAPATAQALRDMGIAVHLEPLPTDLAAAREQVRRLASLAGNPAGESARHPDRRGPCSGRSPAGSRPVRALLWQSGGIVAGDTTLIADLMRHAGLANAAAARGLSQADYLPLERVIADPPELVLTAETEGGEENRLLDHPALARVKGLVRVPIDPGLAWCGGPTIPRALARFAEIRRAMKQESPRAEGRP
ncbi:ABC transporter substrate-binding protein [Novosphingobium panipatense]|uniref:ABC transporter substrate-binding protein n=1 Tax=Novosphingobium panipatense TaxID=428991 RepID=UPI0036210345